jgi:hypothetical protein
MTFQAYLDTIKAKTGMVPDDFQKIAAEKGLLGGDIKAGPNTAWHKEDYGLAPGHSNSRQTPTLASLAAARNSRSSRPPRTGWMSGSSSKASP